MFTFICNKCDSENVKKIKNWIHCKDCKYVGDLQESCRVIEGKNETI